MPTDPSTDRTGTFTIPAHGSPREVTPPLNDRAERVRSQAMRDVIWRVENLSDETPPFLVPVLAANAAMISLVDQLIQLGPVTRVEVLAELADHLAWLRPDERGTER